MSDMTTRAADLLRGPRESIDRLVRLGHLLPLNASSLVTDVGQPDAVEKILLAVLLLFLLVILKRVEIDSQVGSIIEPGVVEGALAARLRFEHGLSNHIIQLGLIECQAGGPVLQVGKHGLDRVRIFRLTRTGTSLAGLGVQACRRRRQPQQGGENHRSIHGYLPLGLACSRSGPFHR